MNISRRDFLKRLGVTGLLCCLDPTSVQLENISSEGVETCFATNSNDFVILSYDLGSFHLFVFDQEDRIIKEMKSEDNGNSWQEVSSVMNLRW